MHGRAHLATPSCPGRRPHPGGSSRPSIVATLLWWRPDRSICQAAGNPGLPFTRAKGGPYVLRGPPAGVPLCLRDAMSQNRGHQHAQRQRSDTRANCQGLPIHLLFPLSLRHHIIAPPAFVRAPGEEEADVRLAAISLQQLGQTGSRRPQKARQALRGVSIRCPDRRTEFPCIMKRHCQLSGSRASVSPRA